MKCERCGLWCYLGPPYHACTPLVKDDERAKFDEIVKDLRL